MLRLIRQRSWFAWLGLFALAGQIVLTLGHSHAGRESDLRDALAGLFEPRVQISEHAAPTTALAGHHRETPADSSHLGGWCAYCGAIAQAASTILPTPVCIRRGHRDDTFSLPLRTTALATGDRASPFDSRGPPLTS